MPVEDPTHPGDFTRTHYTMTLTNVQAKTGIWFFYDETGKLINTRKYKNEVEVPEYPEQVKIGRKQLYIHTPVPFSGIPDCNYR